MDDMTVTVVNDIGVIMRIQGREFQAAEIYEPYSGADMSITDHRITSHLQSKGAALLGKTLGNCALQLVDSDLGRRLQRDKFLIAVIAAFTRNLNPKRVSAEAARLAAQVGLVPMEPTTIRGLISRASEQVDRLTRGA